MSPRPPSTKRTYTPCPGMAFFRSEQVAEFTTIRVELDRGDTDGKLGWVATQIGPATMVVYSGGTTDSGHPKLHVYFALTEPTAETARVGRLRHVLAGKCGGDPAFQRITQIIRVPGTVHAKGGIARTVSIAQHDRKREYDLEDLAERRSEEHTSELQSLMRS